MDILILVAAVLLIGLFCYKNVPTLIGGIVCSVILMSLFAFLYSNRTGT